jgi:type IV pilus assembly protein PilQ
MGLSLSAAEPLALAATVTSLDFKNAGDSSRLEIRSDGPLTFEKQENAQDKQVVIQLKGATLSKLAQQKLDTSSFASRVSLVSPYQVDGDPDTARIVIQLRDPASATVTQDGNVIAVKIPNGGDASAGSAAAPEAAPDASAAAAAAAPPAAGAPPAPGGPPAGATADAPPPAPDGAAGPPPQAAAAPPAAAAPQPDISVAGPKSNLEQFEGTTKSKTFVGRTVNMQLRDADVKDALRLIGEASGFNIVTTDKVKGNVTLSLVDVPWDQALDIVLQNNQLGAERNGNVLRVMSLNDLASEKTAELNAKRAQQAGAPRITRVFPISYADLGALSTLLKTFGNSQAGSDPSSGGASSGGGGAIVANDARTNSIIVQDIPENIERMRKLIEILDTQTPQILIEGKVVETSESFANAISGNLGFGGTGSNQFFAAFNGADPIDQLLGTVFPVPVGTATSSATSIAQFGGGSFGLSPSVSFIPGLARINATLGIGENEGQVKIVSTPRVVVSNGEGASITQTTSLVTTTPGTSTSAPSTTTINADISLSVSKVTVTNDGAVIMDLTLTRAVPTPGTIAANPRVLHTKVVVESGTTLVLGGLFTTDDTHNESGIPVLRKIPIIGSLFGQESTSTDRGELFFFVTPRVLNAKEAGLGG